MKPNNECPAGTEVDIDTLPIDTTSSQHCSKPHVACRYFFVTTSGTNFNGSHSFNTFDLKKRNGKFPTVAECVETSNKLHPDQQNVILLAISEINESDWEQFVSAQ